MPSQAEIFSPAVKEIFRLRQNEIVCSANRDIFTCGERDISAFSRSENQLFHISAKRNITCHEANIASRKRNISCLQANITLPTGQNIAPPSGGISPRSAYRFARLTTNEKAKTRKEAPENQAPLCYIGRMTPSSVALRLTIHLSQNRTAGVTPARRRPRTCSGAESRIRAHRPRG